MGIQGQLCLTACSSAVYSVTFLNSRPQDRVPGWPARGPSRETDQSQNRNDSNTQPYASVSTGHRREAPAQYCITCNLLNVRIIFRKRSSEERLSTSYQSCSHRGHCLPALMLRERTSSVHHRGVYIIRTSSCTSSPWCFPLCFVRRTSSDDVHPDGTVHHPDDVRRTSSHKHLCVNTDGFVN